MLALVAAAFAGLTIPLRELAIRYTVDFTNYYVGGKIVRDGQSKRLYDANLQLEVERQVSPSGGEFQPYLHPPFEALFFAAVAGFSYPHAFLIWAGVNLLLMAFIVYLLPFTGFRLSAGTHTIWLALCLIFMLLVLGLGQDALPLAVIFLLALLALERRRDFLAGIALGVGLYRFQILLPFAFVFLLRRRWKLFAGFTGMGVAEVLVSAAMIGWTGLFRYLDVLVKVGGSQSGPWADARKAVRGMPSLLGALKTLLWDFLPSHAIFLLVLAATLLLLGWAAWEFRSSDHPESHAFHLEFCMATIAALLASYHVFISELTPMIVVAFLILAYEEARKRAGTPGRPWGTWLVLLFLGLFLARALAHFPPFCAEVVPLLALMAWLSRELAAARKSAPTG